MSVPFFSEKGVMGSTTSKLNSINSELLSNSNLDYLCINIIDNYCGNNETIVEFGIKELDNEVYFFVKGSDFEVDWGDNKSEKYNMRLYLNFIRKITHKYEKAGIYFVTIKGNIKKLSYFSSQLTKVYNFSETLEDLSNCFAHCRSLIFVPNYLPINVNNTSNMFHECISFNSNISKWNVSNVQNMDRMFDSCFNFNSDISKWNVSNVRDMSYMFYGCENFNSDLSKWNVSNVQNMSKMFYECKNFNSDISKWNVSNVQNMSFMFCGCCKFNSNLSKWNVSNVKCTCSMFYGCKKLNLDLSKWKCFEPS